MTIDRSLSIKVCLFLKYLFWFDWRQGRYLALSYFHWHIQLFTLINFINSEINKELTSIIKYQRITFWAWSLPQTHVCDAKCIFASDFWSLSGCECVCVYLTVKTSPQSIPIETRKTPFFLRPLSTALLLGAQYAALSIINVVILSFILKFLCKYIPWSKSLGFYFLWYRSLHS